MSVIASFVEPSVATAAASFGNRADSPTIRRCSASACGVSAACRMMRASRRRIFFHVCADEQRHRSGWPQALDNPMEDGAKQRRLVVEAVIEGPLRNPRALRDGVDARRSKAAGEEQIGCDVQDAIAQLRGFLEVDGRPPRRTSAAGFRWDSTAALRLTATGTLCDDASSAWRSRSGGRTASCSCHWAVRTLPDGARSSLHSPRSGCQPRRTWAAAAG